MVRFGLFQDVFGCFGLVSVSILVLSARFGLFRVVLCNFWVILACFGSFRLIVPLFGSFWVSLSLTLKCCDLFLLELVCFRLF